MPDERDQSDREQREPARRAPGDAAARSQAWTQALDSGRLPRFVEARLADARAGRAPWLSTMSPAELLAARSHGIRPVATVSGTCWYHYGYSWTNGHAEGWHAALGRMRAEAMAAGANAIVDVRLRTVRGLGAGSSMDYTVLGTAVRVDGLPPSRDPIVATVTTMEFTRLLEAGIVPAGVAIGACYDWLRPSMFSPLAGGFAAYQTMPWAELSTFWEYVRDQAIVALRDDTARMGNGVLAHTQFGQILRREANQENQPPSYLARYIILGTAIECEPFAHLPHDIAPVVDMRDDLSPLRARAAASHTAYALETEVDGAI